MSAPRTEIDPRRGCRRPQREHVTDRPGCSTFRTSTFRGRGESHQTTSTFDVLLLERRGIGELRTG